MTQSLRIAVADDETRMRDFMVTCLERLGHKVVSAAATGSELVQQCQILQPDLVISDIKMPDMDGIDAAAAIYRDQPLPIILISAHHDPELIARATREHVLAYLIKPIQDTDLVPAISVAMERFREFDMLRKEAASSKQALEDRKIIERAKGIVMRRTGLDEPAAFRRLQKMASNRNQKLVEIARMIITAEEACKLDDL
jgi:response regulator NasT